MTKPNNPPAFPVRIKGSNMKLAVLLLTLISGCNPYNQTDTCPQFIGCTIPK